MKEILLYHVTKILISTLFLVFIVGVGYLITLDQANTERAYNTCIGAGKQYVLGSCIN